MFQLIIPAVLATMPVAYQIDFGTLATEPKGVYDYTVVLSFAGEPDVPLVLTVAREQGPAGAVRSLMTALDDPSWKLGQNGTTVTVFGYDEVRTTKITVAGAGPKPLVRRVPNFPPAKKVAP